MDKLEIEHYVRREEEWTIVFIPEFPKRYNVYGEINGNIFNLRRKYGRYHKRISLTWRNLKLLRANMFTGYSIQEKELKQKYKVYNENVQGFIREA